MLKVLVFALASLFLIGCGNVGMAPEGDDKAAVKAVEKMSLDEKIKFIESSPMPPAAKEKAIAEAKAKAGAK